MYKTFLGVSSSWLTFNNNLNLYMQICFLINNVFMLRLHFNHVFKLLFLSSCIISKIKDFSERKMKSNDLNIFSTKLIIIVLDGGKLLLVSYS